MAFREFYHNDRCSIGLDQAQGGMNDMSRSVALHDKALMLTSVLVGFCCTLEASLSMYSRALPSKVLLLDAPCECA